MTDTVARIERSFEEAGLFGCLHAVALHDTGGEIEVFPDEKVVLASVHKLRLAVAYARTVDAGELDPAERATLDLASRTPGATGIWLDRAASGEQCAFVRSVMAQHVWSQRLAAAFPFDDVVVSGKTGHRQPSLAVAALR